MRSLRTVAVALAFASSVSAETPEDPPKKNPDAGAADDKDVPKISLDTKQVDLKGHRLTLTVDREISHVRIEVHDAEGNLLAKEQQDFKGTAAGTPITVTWTPSTDTPAAKIDLWAYVPSGAWAGVRLIPWSFSIPHQDVTFATGSAEIGKSEEPKLVESLAKIREVATKVKGLGTVTLFIMGHTDSVGNAKKNEELSMRRAQAIAQWFGDHGAGLPVAFYGFGETALLVATKDEVSEPRNRRVDYVLSIQPPQPKGAPVPWKQLPAGP